MARYRFHIGSILTVVLFVAIGVAALREASDLWESGVFSLTVATLLFSILLAMHRTQEKRAFWLGFALFGCVYLALTSIPSFGSRLLTTRALTFLDSKIGRQQVVSYVVGLNTPTINYGSSPASSNYFPNTWSSPMSTGTTVYGAVPGSWNTFVTTNAVVSPATGGILPGMWRGTSENFVRIGHSVLALLAAGLGGFVSRLASERARRRRSPEPGVPVDGSGSGEPVLHAPG
jgi:hypothetical protein